MARNARFAHGSGCYTCRMCQRKTRKVGDGAGVELCDLCYELGGLENDVQDGHAEEWHAGRIAELRAQIAAKGGKLEVE